MFNKLLVSSNWSDPSDEEVPEENEDYDDESEEDLS